MKNFKTALAKAQAAITSGEAYAEVKVRGAVATRIIINRYGWGIRYHRSLVFWVWNNPERYTVQMDAGGFYTSTTARRMNQALALAGKNWRVSRRKGLYVLATPRGEKRFTQFMDLLYK